MRCAASGGDPERVPRSAERIWAADEDGEKMDLRFEDCSGESGGELERRGDGERERACGDETPADFDDFGERGGDGDEDFVSPKSSFVFVGDDCVELLPALCPAFPLANDACEACCAFLRALCTDGDECGDGGTLARDFEPTDDMLKEIPPAFGLRLLKLNDKPPEPEGPPPASPFEDFLFGDSGGERADLRFFLAKVRRPSPSSDPASLFGRSLKSSSLTASVLTGSSLLTSSSSSSCQYAFSRLSPSLPAVALDAWSPSSDRR